MCTSFGHDCVSVWFSTLNPLPHAGHRNLRRPRCNTQRIGRGVGRVFGGCELHQRQPGHLDAHPRPPQRVLWVAHHPHPPALSPISLVATSASSFELAFHRSNYRTRLTLQALGWLVQANPRKRCVSAPTAAYGCSRAHSGDKSARAWSAMPPPCP